MAMGGEIDVKTLTGVSKFKIPEGTQTGEVFTIKGEGIKNVHGRGKGDLKFTAIVDVPKRLTNEQKELLRKLNDTLGVENKKKGFFS